MNPLPVKANNYHFYYIRLNEFVQCKIRDFSYKENEITISFKLTNKGQNNSCTTSDRFVKILNLREGNEESSEETTGCKASVYAEFDDCPRVGKFVKLLDFRHFERHMMFSQSDRKTYKKAISDGVNVSVVLDVGCGNT